VADDRAVNPERSEWVDGEGAATTIAPSLGSASTTTKEIDVPLTFHDPNDEDRMLVIDFDARPECVSFMTSYPESEGDLAALVARTAVYLPVEHVGALMEALDRWLEVHGEA
jgi:hypothetical protein